MPRALSAAPRRTQIGHWIEYSSSHSWCDVLISDHSDKQIANAGCAHLAQGCKLFAIDAIEQQNAAAEHLPRVNRLERPCRCNLLWIHGYLDVTRLELFHAASENDAAVVKEHEIGEQVR